MPYYRWSGVTVTGEHKKGMLFALSEGDLDDILFKRKIALISLKPIKIWFKRPIRLSDRVALFRQLSTLIEAGILVPEALAIVAAQIDHSQLQEKMYHVLEMVTAGHSLSAALSQTNTIADSIIIQLIQAGEESGMLSRTLAAIAAHQVAAQDFYQKLRAALLLPAVTAMFFLGIVVIIFTVIMPRFIDIFSAMHSNIPPLTQRLLAISFFMRSAGMGLLVAGGALIFVIVRALTRRGMGRRVLDWIWLHVPVVGEALKERFYSSSLRAISVLIEGGMPLDYALCIVRDSTGNYFLQRAFVTLEEYVRNGSSLSEAMINQEDIPFSPDVIAMVEVGQESGRLPLLLERSAQVYHDRLMRRLSFITTLIQPLVMILLGLLVALLIFAVYGPIFNMSRIV